MYYIYPFIFASTISFILTAVLRSLGLKYGLVSKPRERDVHKKPLPRIGGVAIFVTFLIVSVVSFYFLKDSRYFVFWSGIDKHIKGILVGGLIIGLSMFLDDVFTLKAWQKIIIQVAAVVILISFGVGIESLPNPFTGGSINLNSVYIPIFKMGGVVYHFSLWSDLLTLVWIVGMMNIINFVDGVDGLAGGISLIASLTIFTLALRLGSGQAQTSLIAAILAGSILGFLSWNFPPAKIFMGDSGSTFLGFVIGALTLVSGGKLATVFLVLGFPIVDGLLVVAGRIKRKENPFTTPDKTHLHHRFLKAGFSASQSIIFMYIISIAFGWVALRSSTVNKLIASVILVVLVLILTRWLNWKIAKKGSTK